MLNILIACDHKTSRDALAAILSAEPLFNVIDVCADTFAAIAITEREQPDIIFIDGSTDALAASQATKKLRACFNANIIAVSRQKDPDFALHMFAAGALGYLTSQTPPCDIIKAVCEVAKHNVYNCFENKFVPNAKTSRFSALKKKIASFRNKNNVKIPDVPGLHWHGILRHTNSLSCNFSFTDIS